MLQQSAPEDSFVLSYLAQRKAVGIIGITLPFVLAVGKILARGHGVETSISHYYYTNMRDFFVGSLCAIGVFMMSTRGYPAPKLAAIPVSHDQAAGILASCFAIGVALFPTSVDENNLTAIGWIHLLCATSLFCVLAYFCIKLFTRTGGAVTRRKRHRNTVYRISGYTILACIGLIAVAALQPIKAVVDDLHPRFWLESVAVFAFGFAWLTKGEMILKDTEDQAEQASGAAAGQN